MGVAVDSAEATAPASAVATVRRRFPVRSVVIVRGSVGTARASVAIGPVSVVIGRASVVIGGVTVTGIRRAVAVSTSRLDGVISCSAASALI